MTQEIQKELLYILKKKKLLGVKYVEIPILSKNNEFKRNLPNSLKELNEYVDNCSLCELSKVKESSFFGKGQSNSSIYIVGLNIDFENKKKYLVLKDMMKGIMPIDDIYMTNILKCKHKKIKKNFDFEVEQCLSYFEKEISFEKPKLIIAFADAFKYIMKNNDEILDISGNVFEYKKITIIPLMELNFLNKNPSYKEKMYQDLKKIKNVLEKI